MIPESFSIRSYLAEFGAIAVLAALGVALSVIAFLHLGQLTEQERRAVLDRGAVALASAVEDQFRRQELLSQVMAGVLSSGRPIDRAEYQAMATRLGALPGVRAVAWLPRTPPDRRPEREAAARADGFAAFTIHPDSTADAFPIFYVEPLPANEDDLGLDLATLPDPRDALRKAGDGGRTTVSQRLPGTAAPEVIVVSPVYAGGVVPPTVRARRDGLLGFIAVFVDVSRLMRAAITEGSERADLYVVDDDAVGPQRLIMSRPATRNSADRRPAADAEALDDDDLRCRIQVGGRDWSLIWRADTGQRAPPPSAWAALTGGLLLTGLLFALALGTVLRRRRAEDWAATIDRSNQELWREIAERRQIEATLGQAENRLQMALKSAPLSLFAQDRELRYTWLFKSRMGLTQEEALGRTDADLMLPQDAEMLTGIKRRVLETGLGVRQEVHLHGRHGQVALDLMIEPMFEPNGSICGIIGTAIDVTAEREGQELLERARQEAVRANEAKSRFLAAASHDLRQPLQATRLFLEVLSVKFKDHPARPVVDKAMTALEASDGLLNSLLDISTLEAGVVKTEVTLFPLNRVLGQLAAETLPQAESRRLRFHAVPCGLWVRSDPVLLERMVRNLLANALRYTDRGGLLLGCRRSGGAVQVLVCDTGPGIPPDKIDEIFEDFVQLGNPERDRSRGLGLGLSVVQRTARLLGHQIGVRSQLGHGSVFWVELPVVRVPTGVRKLVPA